VIIGNSRKKEIERDTVSLLKCASTEMRTGAISSLRTFHHYVPRFTQRFHILVEWTRKPLHSRPPSPSPSRPRNYIGTMARANPFMGKRSRRITESDSDDKEGLFIPDHNETDPIDTIVWSVKERSHRRMVRPCTKWFKKKDDSKTLARLEKHCNEHHHKIQVSTKEKNTSSGEAKSLLTHRRRQRHCRRKNRWCYSQKKEIMDATFSRRKDSRRRTHQIVRFLQSAVLKFHLHDLVNPEL